MTLNISKKIFKILLYSLLVFSIILCIYWYFAIFLKYGSYIKIFFNDSADDYAYAKLGSTDREDRGDATPAR